MFIPVYTSTIPGKLRWFCFAILLTFFQANISGQFKSIGVPEIRNIKRSEYGGGSQNWSIVDDSRGNIYIANNNGVLKFDGADWEIFPSANRSVVRSIACADDDKVYVGAFNEIGVLEKSDKEGYRYLSLNHLIPEYARNFDDVWNIYTTDFGIIFQSFEYVFIYNEEEIQVISPKERFGYSFYVDDKYYVVEKGYGLKVLAGDSLRTVSDDPLFSMDEIRSVILYNSDELLIGTQNNGLYILSDGELNLWNTEISQALKQYKLYSGSFHAGRYLFGTIKSGLFVASEDGTIQQHLSRSNGLQNNTVLSVFIDRQDNTWLGLDIGIDFLKSSLPISFINDNFNIAASYATAIFDDRIYIGTNQGLYTRKLNKIKSHTNIKYDLVEGTEGQVWSLSVIDGQLLCGHHNGAFSISGMKSKKLTFSRGVWVFRQIPGRNDMLIAGTYDGLLTFSKADDGSWEFRKRVVGMDISSRELVVENDSIIWMSHGYLGLYRIQLSETIDSVLSMDKYINSNNLPEELPYILHESGDKFFISTSNGIYRFDRDNQLFVKDDELNRFYGDLSLLYLLKEDQGGNIWYSALEEIGVFRLMDDGTYTNISTPFMGLNNMRVSPFDNIFIQDPYNIFIGTQNGLVHYDPSIYKDYFTKMQVYVNEVIIQSKNTDSLWYTSGNAKLNEQAIIDSFSVPYLYNSISFRFNSPDLENADQIEYSFRLVGFDESWSEWSVVNSKEYTNLREGIYRFEVKARNIYHNVSAVDQFSFIIEPPFYRSRKAVFLYIICGLILISATIYFYFRRIARVRSQEKNKQIRAFSKTEKELEEQKRAAEKEVDSLKNEKLEAEMKHKNQELATSTYHIIEKNKFLNSLKQEISSLSQSAKSEFVEKELKKLSRKIDRDIQNEENWEVFDRYFDEVHQEFQSRLRKLHPELTPGELRLCAYLRMNISTKEIAPLMNISVRGVEISRYRLRKKLKLDRTDNLTDYIMNI